MIDYNIINISQVKTDHLAEFYQKVFNKRHNTMTRHWKWWYRNNYLGYEPLVLCSGNKVIGQAGLIPIKIRVDKEILPAIWFIDFAVLPRFQDLGLGKVLTKAWMKICPNQITFCNDKSLKIFRKFGWEENNYTKRLARPINPTKWIPFFKKFEFNLLSNLFRSSLKKNFKDIFDIKPYTIDDNYKIIFKSFNKRTTPDTDQVEIVRDEEWLNWRLMECPFKKNIYFFEYKENFAIVHILTSDSIKRLHILYTYSLNGSNEDILYESIFKWSLDNSIDLIWANSNSSNQIKKFKKILPNNFSKSMNFASWSENKKIHEKLKLGLNNSQGIDSDNDIVSFDDNYF